MSGGLGNLSSDRLTATVGQIVGQTSRKKPYRGKPKPMDAGDSQLTATVADGDLGEYQEEQEEQEEQEKGGSGSKHRRPPDEEDEPGSKRSRNADSVSVVLHLDGNWENPEPGSTILWNAGHIHKIPPSILQLVTQSHHNPSRLALLLQAGDAAGKCIAHATRRRAHWQRAKTGRPARPKPKQASVGRLRTWQRAKTGRPACPKTKQANGVWRFARSLGSWRIHVFDSTRLAYVMV